MVNSKKGKLVRDLFVEKDAPAIVEGKQTEKRYQKWISLHYLRKWYAIVTFVVFTLLLIYLFKEGSFLLRAISAIISVILFYVVDRYFDIRFRWYHYAFVIIIVVASFLLSPLYYIHPQYDKIQHFAQPILIASLVFYMVSRIELPLKWKIVFTACIVIASLTLFEMAEYTLDRIFDWKLQGVYLRDSGGLEKLNLLMNPFDDTIYDLFFGVLGTCLYGAITAFRLKFFSKEQ